MSEQKRGLLRQKELEWNASSTTYWKNDLGQFAEPLRDSVPSSKMDMAIPTSQAVQSWKDRTAEFRFYTAAYKLRRKRNFTLKYPYNVSL